MKNKRVSKTVAASSRLPAIQVSRPSAISRLPVELLDEICSWTQRPPNNATLSALCLVSRQFCSLAQPRLLSHLNIGGFSTQLRRRPAQLKALSQGECVANRSAKSLTFDFTLSFPCEDPAKVLSPIEIVMHKHLRATIQLCKKVERIVSIVGNHDPGWFHDLIFESSQVLPLTELVVHVMDSANPPLRIGSFANLRKICIERPHYRLDLSKKFIEQLATLISQCPNLVYLEVNWDNVPLQALFQVVNADNTTAPLSIEHLILTRVEVTAEGLELALRHLRAVKTFGLLENKGIFAGQFDENTDIWAILRREKIWLSTLFTDLLDFEGLGSYLQAFHGLEKLYVRPGYRGSAHLLSSPFDLLKIVSMRHSLSLVELDIDATSSYSPGWKGWPFDEAAIKALSSFPNLRIFGVTFGSQHAYGKESTAPESVKSLLDVSLKTFPKLQRITIHMSLRDQHARPHFLLSLPFKRPDWLFLDVHEAIQAYPIEFHSVESMPVIECQGVEYHASINLVTGARSYVPAYPIVFEDGDRAAWMNCRKWKYQTCI